MKNKQSKKPLIILALVLTTLAAASVVFLLQQNANPSQESVQQKTGQQIKEKSISSADGKSGSDQPPAPTPNSSGKSTAQMTLTSANQTDNSLQLRVMISDLVSEGLCTLIMTKADGATYTSEVGVFPVSNSTTCKGFDVPLNELSTGDWNVSISFEGNTSAGRTTKMVTVK